MRPHAALFLALFFACYTVGWAWESLPPRELYKGIVKVEAAMTIRESTFSDLDPVSNLIIQSFYPGPSLVWQHHQRLSELKRLRSSYPFCDKNKARMLVSELSENNEIVGFCFLDDRPATHYAYFRNNPRPMLSDVVVDQKVRRQGIARHMLQICEEIASQELSKPSIYLRVLRENDIAKQMYLDMGYKVFEPSIAGDPPEVLMMVKDLRTTHWN